MQYFLYGSYFFVIIAALFSLIASWSVKLTFKKYSSVRTSSGNTGASTARIILDRNGLQNIGIQRCVGELTDHFDPRSNTIFLSDSVFDATSASAVGVAAHEVGHAIQHQKGYLPIKIRQAIIPITNIGSRLSTPLIIIGIFLSYLGSQYIKIAYAGVVCFAFCVIFQFVTLPSEFNASRRALKALRDCNIVSNSEAKASRKVLSAAAMTYVAALAVSITQLLRLLTIVMRNSRRN